MSSDQSTGIADSGVSPFLAEAIFGLTRCPKQIPGKFLWDEAGSILFDRICDAPDYYPTAREMALLPEVALELAQQVGPRATIVEFGSGASRKIRTLLNVLQKPSRYVAVDIASDYLEAAIQRLAPDYPDVEMIPVCADYGKPFRLPIERLSGPVVGFFPGTSIGNVTPDEAQGLMVRFREAIAPARFLIGVDPTHDENRLRAAYGASDGLMSAFHMNLLARMNRELGADFDPTAFRHEARIMHDPFRMEAHLVSSAAGSWRLGDRTISFEAGESIRTDVSHKYAPGAFRALAERGGWIAERTWLDPDNLFSLHLLRT